MWRLRSLVVLGVLVGVLIFGSVLAQGAWYWNAWYWNAWYWNAEGSGEGVDFRTAWNVADDQTDESIDGDEFNYHATIELRVPQGADFTLMAANAAVETVSLIEDPSLECKADGVESEVAYEVEPLENAQGNKVMVWVTADGREIDHATGHLNEVIRMQFLIPAPEGTTPACYVED